jgi:(5-formylfuran-3-yl)methyl phosphate transaminase
MRAVYERRRKPMVEPMRELGFNIPVIPQGAFYVFADASRWTHDSYAFEFLRRPEWVWRRAWMSARRGSGR